jgi:hypothetical protein
MRLFSVFLALPSATVRLMAARQLQVDDDSREEVDEDELELAEAAAGGGGGAAAADPAVGNETMAEGEKKQKSVRMALESAMVVLLLVCSFVHACVCVCAMMGVHVWGGLAQVRV